MQANQNKIAESKVKNKAGGNAHESRFGGIEKEMRKHKVLLVPSVNTSKCIKFEQAWNKQSERNDIVRVSIDDIYTIVTRDELEQALAYMSQGDELIKYTAPQVGKVK